MAQHHRLPLPLGQRVQRLLQRRRPVGLDHRLDHARPVVFDLGHRVEINRAAAPQPVGAQVGGYPVGPGGHLRLARPPRRRDAPEPQHGFLRHVLGLGPVAQQPRRQPQHPRRQPQRQEPRGLAVAVRIKHDQRIVGNRREVVIGHRHPASDVARNPVTGNRPRPEGSGRGHRLSCPSRRQSAHPAAGGSCRRGDAASRQVRGHASPA